MEDQPLIGWNRDPAGTDRFRYWNGSEWTAQASARITANGSASVAVSGHMERRGFLDSWLFRNTVVFHTLAWFDCSVPLTRGRLRRLTRPVELQTMDQIRAHLAGPES
jgi:hypothetical protein